MNPDSKQLLIVNQDASYLTVDIANASLRRYGEVHLACGSVVELGVPLDQRVKLVAIARYRRNSTLARAVSWLGGFTQILFLLLFRFRKADVLVASNPPLNTLLPLLFRNRIGLYVLDLYPEALYETGFLERSSFIVRIWRKANTYAYPRLCSVWALTPSMTKTIQAVYGVGVSYLPAWASPIESGGDTGFLAREGLEDKWIVVYSGNLGREHDLEVLLDCAPQLAGLEDVLIVIAGDGWKKTSLVQRVEREGISNVKFLPKLPAAEYSSLLSHAKVGVVTQSLRAAEIMIPSKTFNLLAAGLPVLGLGRPDSDFGRVIADGPAGQVFRPDDVEGIAGFVKACKSDAEVLAGYEMGARQTARSFTADNARVLVDEFASGGPHA